METEDPSLIAPAEARPEPLSDTSAALGLTQQCLICNAKTKKHDLDGTYDTYARVLSALVQYPVPVKNFLLHLCTEDNNEQRIPGAASSQGNFVNHQYYLTEFRDSAYCANCTRKLRAINAVFEKLTRLQKKVDRFQQEIARHLRSCVQKPSFQNGLRETMISDLTSRITGKSQAAAPKDDDLDHRLQEKEQLSRSQIPTSLSGCSVRLIPVDQEFKQLQGAGSTGVLIPVQIIKQEEGEDPIVFVNQGLPINPESVGDDPEYQDFQDTSENSDEDDGANSVIASEAESQSDEEYILPTPAKRKKTLARRIASCSPKPGPDTDAETRIGTKLPCKHCSRVFHNFKTIWSHYKAKHSEHPKPKIGEFPGINSRPFRAAREVPKANARRLAQAKENPKVVASEVPEAGSESDEECILPIPAKKTKTLKRRIVSCSPKPGPDTDAETRIGTKLPCKHCSRVFRNFKTLWSHYKAKHQEHPKPKVGEFPGINSRKPRAAEKVKATRLAQADENAKNLSPELIEIKLPCKHCTGPMVFRTFEAIWSHYKTKHPDQPTPKIGDFPGIDARTLRAAREAAKAKRLAEAKTKPWDNLDRSSLTCPICQQTYRNSHLLRDHVKRHVRSVKCTLEGCDASFPSNSDLRCHQIRAHPELDLQKKKCPHCDFESNRTDTMKYHIKGKHGPAEELTHCTFPGCKFSTPRPSKLKSHIEASHEGKKRFLCTECGKGFYQKTKLNRHMEAHEGIKRFECHVCGKRYPTKYKMQQHEATHGNERPFVCDLCGFRFPSRANLYGHMLSWHKGGKERIGIQPRHKGKYNQDQDTTTENTKIVMDANLELANPDQEHRS